LQALETRRNNIGGKKGKYKKIEKLSKTEQKLQKKHPYYLPVFVENYFDKEKRNPATLYTTYKVVG
jgi:hypothetical protein